MKPSHPTQPSWLLLTNAPTWPLPMKTTPTSTQVCMANDAPFFLPPHRGYPLSHTHTHTHTLVSLVRIDQRKRDCGHADDQAGLQSPAPPHTTHQPHHTRHLPRAPHPPPAHPLNAPNRTVVLSGDRVWSVSVDAAVQIFFPVVTDTPTVSISVHSFPIPSVAVTTSNCHST
jgi:hypothetical protein